MEPLDSCSPPDLRHLRRLTDEFGIIQHTRYAEPALEHGYALDDVARALIVVTETVRLFPSRAVGSRQKAVGDERTLVELADIYLRFIAHCQLPDGQFHGFVSSTRQFRDAVSSGDAFGRAIASLGVAIAHGATSEIRDRAEALFRAALPHAEAHGHLRAQAYTLFGLLSVLDEADAFGVASRTIPLIANLCKAFDDSAVEGWPWFEDTVRYSNGVLPAALLAASRHPGVRELQQALAGRAREIGLKSMDFLLETLTVNHVPAPVGNEWYQRGGERSLYDQQCVDAGDMVTACVEAFAVTKTQQYREHAHAWWAWFYGKNMKGLSLYHPEDGAVYDGLTPVGVNENRGAESVLAFLLAHLALTEAFCEKRSLRKPQRRHDHGEVTAH